MKVGDIVLFRKNNTFISKAIAMITGSSYTHVGIIKDVKKDVIVIAEAMTEGFYSSDYKRKIFEGMIKFGSVLIMRPTKSLKDVVKSIEKYEGRPYAVLDLVAILIYAITGHKLCKGSADKLICSEAVARVLYDASGKKIDLQKEYDKPYSYITPDDLFMSKYLTSIHEI